MISPEILYAGLRSKNVEFFSGVPDSLLSSFCAYVDDHAGDNHMIAANEGGALGAAIGCHLSTGTVPVVYMQNSGLGNVVNPLTSLADREVYRIPMVLIIGWRGEPGVSDEPQHVKQGRITPALLELLEVPYIVLDANSCVEVVLDELFKRIHDSGAPVALLVRKNTFSSYKSTRERPAESSMLRETALNVLLDLAGADVNIVSTTGKTSRELFDLRRLRGEPNTDFLTVGGMGHASSIALGVCMGRNKKKTLCIDGDGAALMHLGALPIISSQTPSNFVHILLNNAAHESVGGQPTVAGDIDFKSIALGSGYRAYFKAANAEEISRCWLKIEDINESPVLFEIKVALGSREDLGRPTATPIENKLLFMDKVMA
ncbi:phosphonopyruvate decarboxylase [Alteromonadaceae bacterium Bs31]|nr:phosphonopyruvate decarboxylase [Alteromonadaceae bacterium Bs31]